MKLLRRCHREEVTRFCVEYDRRKKGQPALSDLDSWAWHDARGLESKLREHDLKPDVLPAYTSWWFIELSVADLLECAIVNHIFPGHPQQLSLLLLRGLVDSWQPDGTPEWHSPLQQGESFPPEWALLLRPSVKDERPAKWYVDDGSGRALSLLQRILRHSESWRVAFAYLGWLPDEKAAFIQSHPELRA